MKTKLEILKFPIGHYVNPNIISVNDIDNWIETIENFPLKIKKITENLSDEKLNLKYRPDGWNIKQVVHHCADSHINSYIRFKLALTENNPTIKPYNEAKWAELVDANEDNILDSILIIEGIHARWTKMLKSFNDTDLSKTFIHPENKKSYELREVIGLYAWHCDHHFAHIEQALSYKGNF